MLLCEEKWIMNSSRLITVRGEPCSKQTNKQTKKNNGEVGKAEGKLLNDSPLTGRHKVLLRTA